MKLKEWLLVSNIFILLFLNSLLDPSMALDMFKSTFTNVLPMIAIGGWINLTFSGFLASNVSLN